MIHPPVTRLPIGKSASCLLIRINLEMNVYATYLVDLINRDIVIYCKCNAII